MQARARSLPDQPALELRERAEHVKHEASLRRRRVKSFRQAAKVDPAFSQRLHGFDQLFQGARQAIQLPHHQRVAAARELQCRHQFGAVSHRPGQVLNENPLAPRPGQRLTLQGQVLVNRGNTGVADQHHGVFPGNYCPLFGPSPRIN